MSPVLSSLIFVLYLVSTVGLLFYGLNCYVMLVLYFRRRREALAAQARLRERLGPSFSDDHLPVVTTQIAIYNEMNVAERCIRAVCDMDYPKEKHEIQILDDSTDETVGLVTRLAAELRAGGYDIKVLHRESRAGFKAGALAEGLSVARGELVAVFDADFVPPKGFLRSTAPFFLDDPKLGFVQTRWGHLNGRSSLLTRAQSVGIDGHFVVEQVARSWNNLYMNFNGTAGIWRCSAIREAGGWQWDTLTEDLDLSYRVQFAGWRTLYLPDVVVPAELPEDVNAFRCQQFRWAKGSFQTLLKTFPRLLRASVPPFKKLQAVLHMSGYAVHPMMLTLSVLAVPILLVTSLWKPESWVYAILSVPLCFSIIAPSTLYFVSQRVTYRDWPRRIALLPVLIIVGVGLALSNSRAIFEALMGRQSDFMRTPKKGDREIKRYRIKLPWLAMLEILLGVYSLFSLGFYLSAGEFVVSPFLAIYAAGFLFMGLLTIVHSLGFSSSR
jgi:cellulose synthase/poly-beta-1,6-N-acetylglucosamine synthase-like glycosyltransferase